MEPKIDREPQDHEREDELKLLEMFNRAWDELDPEEQREERAERERWIAAYSNLD